MKVEIKNEEKTNGKLIEKTFPFIAKYGDHYILILGNGIDKYSYRGIMIKGTETYSPFQHESSSWIKQYCEPFIGQITITEDSSAPNSITEEISNGEMVNPWKL